MAFPSSQSKVPWYHYTLAFAAGAASTFLVFILVQSNNEGAAAPLRQSDINPSRTYTFIDPLLGLRNINEESSSAFATLESDIRALIEKEQSVGHIYTASVKMRDLQSSTGFTINPAERYAPASLLKVPTMMTYFKLAEDNQKILTQTILYRQSADTKMPMFPPSRPLTPGTRYTVDELIDRMIRYSDNEALGLLENYLKEIGEVEAYDTVARDLGIENIYATGDFITIQGYGLFWRVLYNATYLTRERSEEALQILSKTDFDGGIRNGVPTEVTVAHKFGEYGLLERGSGKVLKGELHDCGIVYIPHNPYLLCVMTKGKDMSALNTLITEISRLTYIDRVAR